MPQPLMSAPRLVVYVLFSSGFFGRPLFSLLPFFCLFLQMRNGSPFLFVFSSSASFSAALPLFKGVCSASSSGRAAKT